VYVIGEVGIQEELDKKNIRHLGGPEDGTKVVKLVPGYALEHDEDVSASNLIYLSECITPGL
jgi:hypothetical protein